MAADLDLQHWTQEGLFGPDWVWGSGFRASQSVKLRGIDMLDSVRHKVLEDFTCAPKSFRCPASPPTCRVCYCGGSLLRDAHPEAVGSTAFAVNQEACELRAMGLRLLLALVGLLEGREPGGNGCRVGAQLHRNP